MGLVADMFWHARAIADEFNVRMNYYKMMLSLLIFDELQLMDFSVQEDGSYRLRKYENTGKVNQILTWQIKNQFFTILVLWAQGTDFQKYGKHVPWKACYVLKLRKSI